MTFLSSLPSCRRLWVPATVQARSASDCSLVSTRKFCRRSGKFTEQVLSSLTTLSAPPLWWPRASQGAFVGPSQRRGRQVGGRKRLSSKQIPSASLPWVAKEEGDKTGRACFATCARRRQRPAIDRRSSGLQALPMMRREDEQDRCKIVQRNKPRRPTPTSSR